MINVHKVLAAGLALALVTGCGGCTSGSATTPAPPPTDDPAVAVSALRTVDPCALLNDRTLGALGTVAPDSVTPYRWGKCGVEVDDANGTKVATLDLLVGDHLLSTDSTERLEGLPLVLDEVSQGECWVSVVTSHELSLGIEFHVFSPRDACEIGRTALGEVVRAMHDDPAQYPQVPGTLLTADPCAVADERTVETTLGQKPFVLPENVHECVLWSGDRTDYHAPKVSVRLTGQPPATTDGKPVDLGGGVTATQQTVADGTCEVSWRPVGTPTDGEFAAVTYDYPFDATSCEKAVTVARTVVPSLSRR